jgi:hypothetical protein
MRDEARHEMMMPVDEPPKLSEPVPTRNADAMPEGVVDLGGFETRTKAEAGVEVQLKDPDGNPLPVYVRVYGCDSNLYVQIEAEHQRNNRERMNAGGYLDTSRVTPEEYARQRLELLARTTRAWRSVTNSSREPGEQEHSVPYVWINGKRCECTLDNVLRLYHGAPHFADQVDRVQRNRGLFTRGSSAA